jgi:hypothetical protein
VISLNVQNILFAIKENIIHGTPSLRIPVQSPIFIGLNFSLTTLVGIASKRKQLLTCIWKITRAKLERLRSTKLIQGDPKNHL